MSYQQDVVATAKWPLNSTNVYDMFKSWTSHLAWTDPKRLLLTTDELLSFAKTHEISLREQPTWHEVEKSLRSVDENLARNRERLSWIKAVKAELDWVSDQDSFRSMSIAAKLTRWRKKLEALYAATTPFGTQLLEACAKVADARPEEFEFKVEEALPLFRKVEENMKEFQAACCALMLHRARGHKHRQLDDVDFVKRYHKEGTWLAMDLRRDCDTIRVKNAHPSPRSSSPAPCQKSAKQSHQDHEKQDQGEMDDRRSMKDDRRGKKDDRPSKKDDRPSKKTDRPNKKDDRPSKKTDRPSKKDDEASVLDHMSDEDLFNKFCRDFVALKNKPGKGQKWCIKCRTDRHASRDCEDIHPRIQQRLGRLMGYIIKAGQVQETASINRSLGTENQLLWISGKLNGVHKTILYDSTAATSTIDWAMVEELDLVPCKAMSSASITGYDATSLGSLDTFVELTVQLGAESRRIVALVGDISGRVGFLLGHTDFDKHFSSVTKLSKLASHPKRDA